MSPFRRRYLAVPDSAAKARGAVSTFARSHGFAGVALSDIETAAGEAIANAIEHGNRMRGSYSVACAFVDGVLRIEVTDGGAGFDDASRPAVDPPQRRQPSLRGYGIYLMRTLMTSVAFSNGGTTVVLEKRLAESNTASPPLRDLSP